MTILGTMYRIGGTRSGMAVIVEEGECTEASVTTLKSKETGRVMISPVPRQTGLIAKSLDGGTISLESVGDDQIGGARPNCMQVGKTEFFQIAPVQASGGSLNGKRVLGYRRIWQQLSEA